MKPNRLQELKALCDAATPAPWAGPTGDNDYSYSDPIAHEGCEFWPWYTLADRDFAYAARTALPEALEEIEYLEEKVASRDNMVGSMSREIERLRAGIKELIDRGPDRQILPNGKCIHRAWDYEECIKCWEDHLQRILDGGVNETDH